MLIFGCVFGDECIVGCFLEEYKFNFIFSFLCELGMGLDVSGFYYVVSMGEEIELMGGGVE